MVFNKTARLIERFTVVVQVYSMVYNKSVCKFVASEVFASYGDTLKEVNWRTLVSRNRR